MQNNLVTSFISETFDKESKNILLGNWCKPPNQDEILYKNSEIIEYHFDDHIKMENDRKYLCDLFYKILKNLTICMNNFHVEKKPERYWHIVLGPWLINQISILWDRWESLRNAFDVFDLNKTKLIKYHLDELIFADFGIFCKKFQGNHRCNHILFSEIIKFKYSSKIQINFLEDVDNSYIKKNYIVNVQKEEIKLNRKLIDLLLKTIPKNPKILLFDSYFNTRNKILLSLSLREIPRIYSEFYKKIKLPHPKKRDGINFDFEASNDFEKFIKKILIKLIPVSYLEGYKTILSETNRINYNPNIIFTAVGTLINDFFQIWTANRILKGTKLLVSDHGGSWEKDEYFDYFKKVSDFYLSWNKDSDQKCIQVPININLNKKKILKKNKSKKILIISNTDVLYLIRMRQQPICNQIIQDYNSWKIFINNLTAEIKDNLVYRPHAHDQWKLTEKFKKDFDSRFISSEKIFEKDINRSKIIINTCFQTTLYETMKTGIPMIILFNRKTLNIYPKILRLKELMMSNKIIFDDPLKASEHIKKIWDNPLEWWNSDKVLEVRELFSEHCSMETKNNLKYWKEILQNQTYKKS